MGNNQSGNTIHKRDRNAGSRSRTISDSQVPTEDGCPVQVKIAKNETGDMYDPDAKEYPVVFKWHPSHSTQTKQVQVSGSWDGWKAKIPLVKSSNDFCTILNLAPGKHEFRYFVDNKWMVDDHQEKVDNGYGSENNVINIDEADFEVFDALDKDMASSNAGEALRGTSKPAKDSHDTPNDRELEKLHSFTQDIPERKDFDKSKQPPFLPPHLLQVILNKDTPVQCDPNVLPEPNHVMLNHLYALSIKDGVMVLSATHRYRKKFVTTLLYKPI